MDLFLESVAPFTPSWGSSKDWNNAYEKLEIYLRIYGVDSHFHRAFLITQILRRVDQNWQNRPSSTPLASLAIQEANRLLKEWFIRLTEHPEEPDDSIAPIHGRVALFLCDGSQRWPSAFLETRQIPDELQNAMRKSLIHAGPELQIGSMVPRPIDLGLIPEFADDAMNALNRMPMIKMIIGGGIVLIVLTYLFWVTR